ncbi:MAG: SHOCT domain-containing protein [Burkholderiales bacterium]
MRYFFIFRLSAILSLIVLAGCATNPGIVKTGSNTYTLYRVDHGGIFGNANLLRNDVINEANTFADNQGKIAFPIAAKTHPMGYTPADFATFEYQFRLVDKNDKTTIRTHLIPGSDVVADDNGSVVGDSFTKTQSEKTISRYDELIKLDDLRKKGIITETEFNSQKKKLLSNNAD